MDSGQQSKKAVMMVIVLAWLLGSSCLHATDESKARRKALDDMFAILDREPTAKAGIPASSRWKHVGEMMALDARNGSRIRLMAWNDKPASRVSYGLAMDSSDASCASDPRIRRFRVRDDWLVFKATCVGGRRVFTPRNASSRNRMAVAVRKEGPLTVESPDGQTAEYDMQGLPLADAMLKVLAFGVETNTESGGVLPFPGLL
jgi:hypothetical protein